MFKFTQNVFQSRDIRGQVKELCGKKKNKKKFEHSAILAILLEEYK